MSLDEDAAKWKEAIIKDKLSWKHVSNLKGWQDPIALQYGVNQIPMLFIIDANGKIIAKDLHGQELRSKISQLLAK